MYSDYMSNKHLIPNELPHLKSRSKRLRFILILETITCPSIHGVRRAKEGKCGDGDIYHCAFL